MSGELKGLLFAVLGELVSEVLFMDKVNNTCLY